MKSIYGIAKMPLATTVYAASLFFFTSVLTYGQETVMQTEVNGNKQTEAPKHRARVIRDSGGSSIGQYDPSGSNTLPDRVSPYENIIGSNPISKSERATRSSNQGIRDSGGSGIRQPDPSGNSLPAYQRQTDRTAAYGNRSNPTDVNGNKATPPATNQTEEKNEDDW